VLNQIAAFYVILMDLEEKKGIFSFLKLDRIINNLIGFVENRIELLKLELREEAAETGAKLLILASFAILLLFLTIFLSFFLSDYLNDILESRYWGYGIVSGFYLFLILLLALLQKPLNLKVRIKKYIAGYLSSSKDES
jgi:uncharacterized membrane protein YqjE